jgi:hypothetical protein
VVNLSGLASPTFWTLLPALNSVLDAHELANRLISGSGHCPTPRPFFVCVSHAPDHDRSNIRTKVLSKILFNGRADAAFPCGSVSYLSRITMMNFALIGAAAIAARQLWQFLVWRRPLSNIPAAIARISTRNQSSKTWAGNRYTDGFRDDN